jgi:hypothetical protein
MCHLLSINNCMDLYFFLLLVKHAIVDVGIQRHLGWMGKEKYFSKLAQMHYVGHGIGTFLVLSGTGIVPALIAGVVDWWCHWQIDYTKSRINHTYKITASNKIYWWILTIDQLLHYLTYLIIVQLFI